MRPYDHRLLHGTLRLLEEQNGQPIDESAVADWLNTVYTEYAEDYAQTWQQEFTEAARSFEREVLSSLVAFNADRELEHLFYAAFDSVEVLPQRFEREYFALMQDGRFVDADALLVGIAHWQYGMLKGQGRVRPGDRKADDALERVNVVTATYDDDLGLLFNR